MVENTGSNSIKQAENIFIALLTLGLVGLLFLIIYGNLQGNLGFSRDSNITANETGHFINTTGSTLGGVNFPGFISISSVEVYNESNLVPSANYTINSITGIITNATVTTYPSVNVTYTTTFKQQFERDTDNVIGNLTSGATTFFTFSNVWFVLTAITILIAIVIGVIALVRRTSGGSGGSKKGPGFTN